MPCLRSAVFATLGGLLADNSGYDCTGEKGRCGCPHAEMVVIVNALKIQYKDELLTVTLSPCMNCANLIIAVGFIRVVRYYVEYRDPHGIELLRAAGIKCYLT